MAKNKDFTYKGFTARWEDNADYPGGGIWAIHDPMGRRRVLMFGTPREVKQSISAIIWEDSQEVAV